MEIPKEINKNNRDYVLVKEYSNYFLYEDVKTKAKECFTLFDLGLIEKRDRVVGATFSKNNFGLGGEEKCENYIN